MDQKETKKPWLKKLLSYGVYPSQQSEPFPPLSCHPSGARVRFSYGLETIYHRETNRIIQTEFLIAFLKAIIINKKHKV